MKRTLALATAVLATTLGLSGIATPHANAALIPGAGYTEPEISDINCKLTKRDPYPVVLIHGTWASAQKWKYLTPPLREAGFCVWGLNFGYDPDNPIYNNQKGIYATAAVKPSIKEIDDYVKKVLKITGAKKVNIVAHSQGGFLTKIWLHEYKANAYVNNVVLLAGTVHGTDMSGIVPLVQPYRYPLLPDLIAFFASEGAENQMVGSPTVKWANSMPDTMPGVHYTSIMTKDDQTATPYTTGILKKGPGATVQNVIIQDKCYVNHEMPHNGLVEDPLVRPVIIRGLRNQPANCNGTPWEVPAGYVGASHKGEGNGYAGDADQSDYVVRSDRQPAF